ncbi:MAG: PLP-dependent transferase, partial [Thermoanaerobaculia bacterium]|nr:PLP-dependent transferase [Thermoanaerobaculia bacterium]
VFETAIARLERAEAAKAFASGMGAVAATMGALLSAGDHLLFVNQTYGPTLQLARRLGRQGIEHDLVLDLDLESIAAAFRPTTRMVWMESPGTMLFRTFDVRAVAAMARERDAVSVLDNSWATPLLQKPLTFAVDLAVHSATKYLAGHCDLVAGVLAGRDELVTRIFRDGYLLQGASLAPFDGFLLLRGMRTLPLRMRRHHESGLAVARWLAEQPRVRHVFHPGLAGDSGGGSLTGYSGLFSFQLDTEDPAVVRRFVDALNPFRIGISWGGVESLVFAPLPRDGGSLRAQRIPLGLVRLSIGLEPVGRLLDGLETALQTSS